MLLLALACAPPEAAAPGWTAPDAPGPYGAGVETLAFTDSRGKDLVIELWYPADPPEGASPDPYPEIPISLNAHRGAPVDARGAPYPMVAFSHGMGGIRYQSAYLMEHLASHGYVLAAVDHPRNTFLDMDEGAIVDVFLERPGDVQQMVDEVFARAEAADPLLGGLVDPEAGYAMMGHSFGAWTALAVGGGALDLGALTARCAAGDDGIACDYLADIEASASEIPDAADPRVRTTIALSPGVWYSFGPGGEGLRGVRAPLLLAGDADTVLPYEAEVLPTYAALGEPKALGTLSRGGHYAFTDICLIAAPLFDDCDEEAAGFIEMDRAHEISRAVVAAQLDLVLYGEARAAPWLGGVPDLLWSSAP